MEALRLWTPYSRWKYREPHEYPARVCRKAPVAKLSCEAATEENAKRRSFMPRTQVTGKANFSPGITSGLPARQNHRGDRWSEFPQRLGTKWRPPLWRRHSSG